MKHICQIKVRHNGSFLGQLVCIKFSLIRHFSEFYSKAGLVAILC